jgi:hypothetical protein
VASNRFGHRAGWGGDVTRAARQRSAQTGEGSSEPSLVDFIDLFGQLALFLPGIIRSGRALEALAVERAGSTVPGCLSTVGKRSRFPKNRGLDDTDRLL